MTKVDILSETASDSLQPTAVFNEIDKEEVKSYFSSLYKLVIEKGDDEFCIDLDDVFHYAYKRRQEAVRALTKSNVFINGCDYIVLRKAAQGQFDSRTKIMMTIRCFEFFIVRKNRNLFDVYRTVFHFVLSGNVPKQIVNVIPVGIISKSDKLPEEDKNPYPEGYNSIKQILKSLGYKHIRPKQVFRILVERGLLKEQKKDVVIRKRVSVIYSSGEQLESGVIINRGRINDDTIQNQLLFKESEVINLFNKAGINLSNESFLSEHY